MKMMITCKQATDMVSKKEEGKLSFLNKIQLWFHLFICTVCKLFYRQNELIIKNASGLSADDDASLTPEQKSLMIEVILNTKN